MRSISFIVAALILFASLAYKGEEDVLTWSNNRKLSWDDYKGKPQKRFAAASTVYSLGREVYDDGAVIKARITAYFYCQDSWKKDDWISDEVLAHEQRHFDIVELFARRLRKQLGGMVFLNLKDAEKKVESMYQIVSKEMDLYQDKYDTESDGSMNGDGQRKWNKKIAEELSELEDHTGQVVRLKLRSGN